jgi:hypothetical protein
VAGANGASPWIEMSDLGLDSAFNYAGRLRYQWNVMELPVNFVFDYSYADIKGHVSNYQGDVIGTLTPAANSEVDSRLKYTLLAFNAEIDASPSLDLTGYDYPLEVGPKLSYVVYQSSFRWSQVDPVGPSEDRSRSFGMPGIGIWACLNLANLTGYGATETSAGTIEPKLHFSTAIGKGSQMQYYMWDATLEVISRPEASWDAYTFPGLTIEVGIGRYRFDETLDRLPAGLPPGAYRTGNCEHTVDTLIARFQFDLPWINY